MGYYFLNKLNQNWSLGDVPTKLKYFSVSVQNYYSFEIL